jgi:hypothetical protein
MQPIDPRLFSQRAELVRQINVKDTLISQLLKQLNQPSAILTNISLVPAPNSATSPPSATSSQFDQMDPPITEAAARYISEKSAKEIEEWKVRALASLQETDAVADVMEAPFIYIMGDEGESVGLFPSHAAYGQIAEAMGALDRSGESDDAGLAIFRRCE